MKVNYLTLDDNGSHEFPGDLVTLREELWFMPDNIKDCQTLSFDPQTSYIDFLSRHSENAVQIEAFISNGMDDKNEMTFKCKKFLFKPII